MGQPFIRVLSIIFFEAWLGRKIHFLKFEIHCSNSIPSLQVGKPIHRQKKNLAWDMFFVSLYLYSVSQYIGF